MDSLDGSNNNNNTGHQLDTLNPSEKGTTSAKPAKRRERLQLSCGNCRQRKLRCDRSQPCENCKHRGRDDSCVYMTPPQHEPKRMQRTPGASTVQNRVKHLEQLVLALVSEKSGSGPTPDSLLSHGGLSGTSPASPGQGNGGDGEHDVPTESIGQLNIRDSCGTRYFDSGHWAAILADIAEVKTYFEDLDVDVPQDGPVSDAQTQYPGPDLLVSRFAPLSRDEVVSCIPPRPEVDRLVFRYFNSMDQSTVILHRPTFQREYDDFWENPHETPIMWIGLLFTIMSLATSIHIRSSDELPSGIHDPHAVMTLYRHMAVHCLYMGDYSAAGAYALDTLILYFHAEFARSHDVQLGHWLLFGIIARVAFRMGYHRDAHHYPSITAFQGEMRRRIWQMILQMDLLTSVQVGLPRLIKPSQVDTCLPRNLHDDDFDEDTTELPPSRSDSEHLVILYLIVKSRLATVFGMVVDLNGSTQSPSYSDVMKLDRALIDGQRAIPYALQMLPMEASVTNPPFVIMRRFTLDLFYQKCLCILHRKFFNLAWSNPQYQYSRNTCITAAKAILKHQAVLHRETQPGGLLHRDKWMLSSLTMHDFLLAAMIICLDLDRTYEPTALQHTEEDRQEMIQALEQSYEIWKTSASTVKTAYKATKVLSIILRKVGSPVAAGEMSTETSSSVTAAFNNGADVNMVSSSSYPMTTESAPAQFHHHHAPGASITLADMLSMPVPFPENMNPPVTFQDPVLNTSAVENLIGSAGDLNWDMWDSLFRDEHPPNYPFSTAQHHQQQQHHSN
ncbi:hypothetical protein AJ80_01824 [Polytolypa hystricis UAMH7299]|uniref:Zn(2)-C6 fungal-type domain-containing protein n=1 Tax=Polytolypa hystricis (strain UAMH7299) TaxID=1447883 RepID=A0A2B7YZD2_POLH7|nr:hypothetical protein AJ80_01824 [Polytolypa hystricis UAMH7299]